MSIEILTKDLPIQSYPESGAQEYAGGGESTTTGDGGHEGSAHLRYTAGNPMEAVGVNTDGFSEYDNDDYVDYDDPDHEQQEEGQGKPPGTVRIYVRTID